MTIEAPRRVARDQSRLNLIDYLLMGIGASLAAYTAGMAIQRADTAQYLATAVLLGTLLSYCARSLLGRTPVVKADGILYAAAIGCAVVGFQALNRLLPEEGFPRDVMMAGVLSWMLVLGSALTWRDGTLLFQAIPSVALFGLVGCYDTYAYAPYMFFGFLLCLAIVLARANRREMMRQAVESGYFNRADAPSTPQEFPEQSPELYEDIRRGPWRWLAGPEWALISALAIVLLSRLGAPVLQEAAKPITAAFPRIPTPQSLRTRLAEANNTTQPTTYQVGRGPNHGLTEHVVYFAQLDRPRYLRTAAFETYTGRGWSSSYTGAPSYGGFDAVGTSLHEMGQNRHSVSFAIMPADPTRQLPLPAEPLAGEMAAGSFVRPDGGGNVLGDRHGFVNGTLAEPTIEPTDPPPTGQLPPEFTNVSLVPPRVRQFALDAAQEGHDGREKAVLIAEAIARQVRYNIDAAAVPANEDPVQYFLFSSKEGYCDLFASAMTVCARSAGLPARYVIGFLPEQNDGAGNYAVREADYHAWCEVFFKGVGWVVFDATEGADQVAGAERGSSDESRPWYTGAWVAPTARGILAVFAVTGGVVVLRRLKPRARPPRWDVHRAYVPFERSIRRATGRKRLPGETIETYALSAAGLFGPEVGRLGSRFARALYGPAEPSEEDVRGLRETTKALRRQQGPKGS